MNKPKRFLDYNLKNDEITLLAYEEAFAGLGTAKWMKVIIQVKKDLFKKIKLGNVKSSMKERF